MKSKIIIYNYFYNEQSHILNMTLFCDTSNLDLEIITDKKSSQKIISKNYFIDKLQDKKYKFELVIQVNDKIQIYCVNNESKFKIFATKDIKRKYKFNTLYKYIVKGIKIAWKNYHFIIPFKELKRYLKLFYNKVLKKDLYNQKYFSQYNKIKYNEWLKNHNNFTESSLKYKPLISIIIPVYNIGKNILLECINSILNQTYQNFEICLVDDNSTNAETIDTLKELENNSKIKILYRKTNGNISIASNDALKMSKGEYIALMDDDDALHPQALYKVVEILNNNHDADFIYTDEDKIDYDGEMCEPHFKPNWSPETLLSHNYISHFSVIKKNIIKKLGGFRTGYEGAQDYDLFLRISEITDKIVHIPCVLYHWRKIPGSTSDNINSKSYASLAGQKALKDALKRRNISGTINNYGTAYSINYKLVANPLVSIIILTRDKANLLNQALDSIYKNTTYKNYEVIVIDNDSNEKTTFELFNKYSKKHSNFKVITEKTEFNYAFLNNIGAKESLGEYLVFLNNDIKIITLTWLDIMLGYAMQKEIAAVGPLLLFEDKTIQHAGVVLGVGEGNIANHAFYQKTENEDIASRLKIPYNYSAVTGACLMIEKTKFLSVGGFTEKLKVNYNDVDLCLKFLYNNYRNVVIPQVKMYHFESKTRGSIMNKIQLKNYEIEKNYMTEKWQKYLTNDNYYNENYSKNRCYVLEMGELENEK